MIGLGTNFGLILVFLRSVETIDVPLGNITPPSALLNVYSTFAVEEDGFINYDEFLIILFKVAQDNYGEWFNNN